MRSSIRSTFVAALGLAMSSAAGGAALAQSPAPEPTLASTAACLERAEHETDLVPAQRARLCVATPTPRGPIDCYLAASRGLLFTDPQSIQLCRCSAGTEPIDCVRRVRGASRMTDPEMIALCSPTLSLLLDASCRSHL